MASSLANLREWIGQSPHLRNIRQDDQVGIMFFSCDFVYVYVYVCDQHERVDCSESLAGDY